MILALTNLQLLCWFCHHGYDTLNHQVPDRKKGKTIKIPIRTCRYWRSLSSAVCRAHETMNAFILNRTRTLRF
jgi:hypothetical protein